MTIDQARSTNGSGPTASIGARPASERSDRARHPGLRRLALPVALALGVIFLLRYFESSTASS
ncbi:MAG: hypothetical protein EPO22_00745 [Dehalococcoidia bacterium]|nr:MAG: hypothetical protein EPO22_00745 [Dehalococcoidia bacterium]